MKLTNLFILGISLFNLTLPAKANPTFIAQSSCQASVNEVIRQIKNKGVSQVKFFVNQGLANDSHKGNPTNRNDILLIVLGDYNMSNSEDYSMADILNSLILMNIWANEIVKNCGNTSVVSFGAYQTDWIVQYAIQENGTTKQRECAEPQGEKLDWNQQYCL